MPAESELSELQKELFEVPWSNCREKLGADIEGSMTKSALEAHKILACECCSQTTVIENIEEHQRRQSPNKATEQSQKEGPGGGRRQNVEEGKRRDRFEEYQGVESITASREDLTIIMEIMMYTGKDVNLVEVFKMFKTIHQKGGFEELCLDAPDKFDENIRDNFNRAISDLKYMGFISSTK